MKKEFYSNGKLLITAEYLVLDGSEALAVPTKMGQYLVVEPVSESQEIYWESQDADGTVWYSNTIPIKTITERNPLYTHDAITETLLNILNEAHSVNKTIFAKGMGYRITTKLTFPRQWGLGTSSTLINNVAQWFGIDAFELLHNSFGGSGYDIACAQTNSPITYKLIDGSAKVTSVSFLPLCKENLFFVYLNVKRNSREAIESYRQKQISATAIHQFSGFTQQALQITDLQTFQTLIDTHEQELSQLLKVTTIKQELFSDFSGSIKSLGAWGGDFILVATQETQKAMNYFRQKGYETILSYNEMVLS